MAYSMAGYGYGDRGMGMQPAVGYNNYAAGYNNMGMGYNSIPSGYGGAPGPTYSMYQGTMPGGAMMDTGVVPMNHMGGYGDTYPVGAYGGYGMGYGHGRRRHKICC
eukprot:TRINITY_DN24501_c0_g1_i1.p2 TRINITY_DN24501_c0_g1~~TRINITY_DN24501_c0_g1_i1.p2  ORF type:complete len:106 (-),score=8.64 TRINITY_DN24501_c0_g1_i1:374-691(-)